MEEENQEEKKEEKKKVSLAQLRERFNALDPKQKKIAAALVIFLFLLPLLGFFLFSSEEEVPITEQTVDLTDMQRPVDFINLTGPDGKETEIRATIKEEDRVMQFSMSFGLEKKELRQEVLLRMAPLLSEILIFFSTKTKEDILEMIQDPDGKEREKLLKRLNLVLKTAGESKLDLKQSGRIVRINFTKYYFPSI